MADAAAPAALTGSFCESAFAPAGALPHIRLRPAGEDTREGGGVTGPTLCGRTWMNGWDLPGTFTPDAVMGPCCEPCRVAFGKLYTEAWCITHNQAEPDLPGDYKACLECRHVFRTAADLLAAENEVRRGAREHGHQMPDAANADEIYSCPHCTHDW